MNQKIYDTYVLNSKNIIKDIEKEHICNFDEIKINTIYLLVFKYCTKIIRKMAR